MQQGDQGEVRGGDGIDLDEDSRDGEKLLGSGHVLEVGASMNLNLK